MSFVRRPTCHWSDNPLAQGDACQVFFRSGNLTKAFGKLNNRGPISPCRDFCDVFCGTGVDDGRVRAEG